MFQKIDAFDKNIVLKLNQFFSKHAFLSLDKFFAEYLIYSLPLIFVVLWFYPVSPQGASRGGPVSSRLASRGGSSQTKKVVLRAFFAVILAWPILAHFIGKFVNRPRPFETTGIKELIFHRPDVSFPSDHAAALFAVAFSFWFSGYKKLAAAMFAIAIVVSFFRVASAIHYPTDILGGLVIGLAAAYLIDLFDKPLNIIYSFILKIFGIIRLA